MKKNLWILLLLVAMLSLAGCGGTSEEANDDATLTTTEDAAQEPATTEEVVTEEAVEEEPTAEVDSPLAILTQKYNEMVPFAEEVMKVATENGWDKNEFYAAEFDAATKLFVVIGEDIENPETMDDEYMVLLSDSLDEMKVAWEKYAVEVSVPYVAE